MNDAEWLFIRDTILLFFQDVHIRVRNIPYENRIHLSFFFILKVSVFLREDLQTQEGQFVIKTNGVVPTGFQPPGEIRFVFQ